MTDEVDREGSLAAKGNPEDLSTMTNQFWLLTWKISIPTEDSGGSILSGSTMDWVLGFEDRYRWQDSQESVICLMSLAIPCQ